MRACLTFSSFHYSFKNSSSSNNNNTQVIDVMMTMVINSAHTGPLPRYL